VRFFIHCLRDSQSSQAAVAAEASRGVVDLGATDVIISVIPPEELVFTGAINEEICEVISLENLATHALAYKVRTTQPERYRVRPRSGVLRAGDIASLQVLRKAVDEGSVPEKDHFLVMSVGVTDEEADLLADPKGTGPSVVPPPPSPPSPPFPFCATMFWFFSLSPLDVIIRFLHDLCQACFVL